MGGRKKDREFWESAALNNNSYRLYYDRLVELAISMFEWSGLPDTIDERFIELTLFSEGQCVFFKDDVIGYLCLQNILGGDFNVYRIPNKRRAFAVNGYQKDLSEDNSVIIFNNYLHTNSKPAIVNFSQRLWDLDRTIDINAKAQKTPVVIQCTEEQRLTMLNLYKKYEGNEPFIYADKHIDLNGLKVLNTNAPYVCDKLYQLKTEIWNEALTYLGISNVNIVKKERLVTDEAIRSSGGVIASRYSRLETRRQACKKINEMFGLDIWVDYRADFREADDEIMIEGDTGSNELTPIVTDLRTDFNLEEN